VNVILKPLSFVFAFDLKRSSIISFFCK